jgi:hypothetical protein
MNFSKTHTRICHHCPPSNPERYCGLDHLRRRDRCRQASGGSLPGPPGSPPRDNVPRPHVASNLALVGDLVLPWAFRLLVCLPLGTEWRALTFGWRSLRSFRIRASIWILAVNRKLKIAFPWLLAERYWSRASGMFTNNIYCVFQCSIRLGGYLSNLVIKAIDWEGERAHTQTHPPNPWDTCSPAFDWSGKQSSITSLAKIQQRFPLRLSWSSLSPSFWGVWTLQPGHLPWLFRLEWKRGDLNQSRMKDEAILEWICRLDSTVRIFCWCLRLEESRGLNRNI